MKHIVDRELFCKCQKCEEAVADILRMELMLCQGAKSALSRRRTAIKRERRRSYYREYDATRRT